MRTLLILAFAALAGAAEAQTRAESVIDRFKAEAAPMVALKSAAPQDASLSAPELFLKTADDGRPLARPKGTVQTAVDRAWSKNVVGSLGYLCGLQPGPNDSGGVASSREPAGTFLGGQLHVTF